MHKTITYLLLLCGCSQGLFAQSGQHIFDNATVHEIRIFFDDPGFWDTLTNHYNISVDTTLENVPLSAQVIIDGDEVDSVGVSQKGYYSNWGAGGSLKKPLKLDFNYFVNGGKYDDVKSLNLQNAFMDPSLMRDVLAYKMLRDFGVAASRTSYAKVYINDSYWGLYVLVESVNKTFLEEHFGNNDGNLYKANWTSLQYLGDNQDAYSNDFELKTNESTNDWSRLIYLIKKINQTNNNAYKDTIPKYLDMESYLKTMAVDVTINNWDSYFGHGRNFYLYDNPTDGKFYWIPWDYNLAFSGDAFSQYDITLSGLRSDPSFDKILTKKVFNNPTLKAQYLQHACHLHHGAFTEEHLFPFIESTGALIRADLEADPNKFYPNIEDFDLALTTGFDRTVVDTFHFVDSIWNGFMWEHIDTIFIWEYQEIVVGLEAMIATRNPNVLDELSSTFNVTCQSPATEPEAITMEIWPNPAAEWINLKIEERGVLSLFDVNGRLRKRTELEPSEINIPLRELSPGVYWLQFESPHGRKVQKVVVQR